MAALLHPYPARPHVLSPFEAISFFMSQQGLRFHLERLALIDIANPSEQDLFDITSKSLPSFNLCLLKVASIVGMLDSIYPPQALPLPIEPYWNGLFESRNYIPLNQELVAALHQHLAEVASCADENLSRTVAQAQRTAFLMQHFLKQEIDTLRHLYHQAYWLARERTPLMGADGIHALLDDHSGLVLQFENFGGVLPEVAFGPLDRKRALEYEEDPAARVHRRMDEYPYLHEAPQ